MAQASAAGAPEPSRQPAAGTELLAGLSPDQASAVRHGPGPLLLIAGPGTGKTHTLTYRIAWLLTERLAEPHEILAVTFSVRAAGELRLRLAELLGERVACGVTAATFHSVCARLLREHAELFGRTDRYTIYDQVDMRRVLDWLLSHQQRGQIQRALADYGQPASAELLAEISRAKNRLLTPESFECADARPSTPLVAAVWRESEAELRRSDAWDFDDLLAFTVRLLGEHPHRLAWLRQRWRWILADEFQDTSHAQAALVDLLAGPNGNLCVVGDDDQVIHTWRHADPRHILCFHERHPARVQIVLGRNRRSHSEILEAALRCVSHNEHRTPKALIAIRGPGGRIEVAAFTDEHQEARWVAGEIAGALAAGVPPTEIMALARSKYVIQPLETALEHAGIPHRVLGSLGLYERSEVVDALAYLTLIANPRDAQAFARAAASRARGAGPATVTRLVAWARERHRGDLITASANAPALKTVRNRTTRERLAQFGLGLERVRRELRAGRSLGHTAIGAMMLPGGLVAHHQTVAERSTDAGERRDAERVLEDLRSLCRAVQAYEERDGSPTLTGFLEYARGLHARELTPGQEDRRITLSTIHRSKGTEARLVILAGCEERLLPSWRSLESSEQLQEERRLFYVACTRAKDRLHVTHAATRGGRQTAGPSRFLAEAGLLEPLASRVLIGWRADQRAIQRRGAQPLGRARRGDPTMGRVEC